MNINSLRIVFSVFFILSTYHTIANAAACNLVGARCGGGTPTPAPVETSPVPAGAPPVLSNPEYYKRCSTNTTGEDVQGCLDLTKTTTLKCLTDVERQWALDHSLGVVCVGAKVHSVCPCSCFEQSTRILSFTESGHPVWKNVLDMKKGERVASLNQSANLRNISFDAQNISYQTNGPEKKPLVVIHAGKNTLKVTETHAVVMADGRVIEASSIKVGDMVLGSNGAAKTVRSIEREFTDKDVINFLVDKPLVDKKSHIISAEGILVGDMQWQNYLREDLNKVLLRR